jgi:hypothetical protein
MDKAMIERNLQYISLQWADIHHSRQQEWKALAVIAGIFYAIAQVDLPQTEGLVAKFLLGAVGILSASLGACISWQHNTIRLDKFSVISRLERQIGIQYPMRTVLLPVNVLLFLLFGGICSVFVGITLGYVVELGHRKDLQIWAYGAGVVFLAGFFAFAVIRRLKAVRIQSYGFKHPFCAEMQDLEQCLASLGPVPLKLVVGGTLDRNGIREEPWVSRKWTYRRSDGSIIKDVLLNRRDVFQFSLANASSRQDWHYHNSTFEVYVSDDAINLAYEEPGTEGKQQTLRVNRGVLIIPPEIPHKVSLSGNTFVFQAMLAGPGLAGDKFLVRES